MLFGLIVLRARTGNMLLVSLGLLVDARSCLLGVLFRRFQVSSRHRSLGPSRWRYEVIFWKAVCCSHGWFRNLIWCDLETVVIFCSFSHHGSCNALWMSLRLHWGLMALFEYVMPKWLNDNPQKVCCSFLDVDVLWVGAFTMIIASAIIEKKSEPFLYLSFRDRCEELWWFAVKASTNETDQPRALALNNLLLAMVWRHPGALVWCCDHFDAQRLLCETDLTNFQLRPQH